MVSGDHVHDIFSADPGKQFLGAGMVSCCQSLYVLAKDIDGE